MQCVRRLFFFSFLFFFFLQNVLCSDVAVGIITSYLVCAALQFLRVNRLSC